MIIELEKSKYGDVIQDNLEHLKTRMEKIFNLSTYPEDIRPISLNWNKVLRFALIVGLSDNSPRSFSDVPTYSFGRSLRFSPTFFSMNDMKEFYSAMLKLRYRDDNLDWTNVNVVNRILSYEIERGNRILTDEEVLESWLFSFGSGKKAGKIPVLDLIIGDYEGEIPAKLDVNSRNIPNNQILIAGTTGSGKTNLLALIIQQLRTISTESSYPVNFLLFDYKGEFSDPKNEKWLGYFDVNKKSILRPIESPLPFSPFKDFTDKPINEINLYSSTMATALCSIDRATVSANMNNRLSEAIVEAYKVTKGMPITFKLMLEKYQALKGDDNDDSVTSVLKQMIRNNVFADSDHVELIKDSYIIDLGKFPKDGVVAKAIVYFVISKLNNIYESLPVQETDSERVQIRHFTIIDEAHYMLSFDNKPLRDLIAVGRNKGMSILLATQNMSSFKSEYFDFYANAQYPLIMKQQSINDPVLKDIFGVSGKELQELRTDIGNLQKGELIIKDANAALLGLSKKWKKIKITHII